jgi:Tfp pilus assembly protein PilW
MSSPRRPRHSRRAPGFTLVEVLIAATIGVFVLAGVLAANLQVVRGSIQLAGYAEMDAQVRRALEFLGRDLRSASALVWNGPSDLTLTLPAAAGTTTQVTYAWTAESASFFRVAGSSSAVVTGRLELVRDLPAAPDGSAGLVFARFDRDGVAATTDAATKRIQVSMTLRRSGAGRVTGTHPIAASFTLRSKRAS